MGDPAQRASTGPQGPVLFALLALLLVFAPLYRGGNRPVPLLAMEIAALLGLAAWLWPRPARAWSLPLPSTLAWGIGLLLAVPLLQLVPLPSGWWAALPGHAPYFEALQFAGDASRDAMRPISLHPRATHYAWLAMLPCLAVFVLTLAQPRSRLRMLAAIFVAAALLQAVLGIMQFGTGARSALYFDNPHAGGSAAGTYINKNHFAALMAMALPMALALWALAIMPPERGGVRKHHPRHADRRLAIHIALSVLVLLLLVALLFSGSRGGIGAGLLAFALASFALVWRSGSVAARSVFGIIAFGALALATYVGLTPVLDRFTPENLSLGYEGRARIAAAAVRAGLDFLPFGSGLGTFADVFRRYQVEGLPGFVQHAHNDYAQLFLEMGVAGLAALVLVAIAYLSRWGQLARALPSRSLGYLQVGAGLGMLAMIVHGGFDFNFHIPANALYFSFLAGIFFFTPDADRG